MSTIGRYTDAGKNLQALAAHAYDQTVHVEWWSYDHGYLSGVEDLARLLTEADPAISERLTKLLTESGWTGRKPRINR